MKIYAPKYYGEFACVADKCEHSCCVGWDVYIDSVTMEKYRALDSVYADEIRKSIDTPLVLHGGSGLSDDDFKNTIKEGIAKVNIFTDLCLAGAEAMKQGLEKGLDYLAIRNLKVELIKQAVMNKMKLFGCDGKA